MLDIGRTESIGECGRGTTGFDGQQRTSARLADRKTKINVFVLQN